MSMIQRRRALAALAACAAPALATTAQAQAQAHPRVLLKTSLGDIVLELNPAKAPKTVANFLQYVRDKHYDGTVFHRVIDGFMIQGGGMDAEMREKSTRAPIPLEAANGLRNDRGAIAMARTGDPNSATSQFFVNVVDNARLDPVIIPPGDPVPKFEYMGQTYEKVPRANLENHPQLYGYTVFGKVVSGMDTVEKIRNAPTGAGGPFPTDVPQKMVVIESATLLK